jgi:hypothetical protein
MGMERVITFSGAVPSWKAIQQEAAAAGLTLTVRMIDNLPAFPDEVPEDGWKELRVGVSSGMITLRQQPGRLSLVIWGNADNALQSDSDRLAQACARAANGSPLPESGNAH